MPATTNSTHVHSVLSRIRGWRPLAKVTAVGADFTALQWNTTRDGSGSYPI